MDTYRRRFDGDVAQCGCRWERQPDYGDVLVQCPLHQAHTDSFVREMERKRELEGHRAGRGDGSGHG